MALRFLTLSQDLAIHIDQLSRYGGSTGIRDSGLLESALAMPEQTMFGEYLRRDVFEMASAYLYHLVQNHPFVDGNKRVGTVVALVASGEMDKRSLIEFLRGRCVPSEI